MESDYRMSPGMDFRINYSPYTKFQIPYIPYIHVIRHE